MLVFDFDGVLIDSVTEVALSAYNAAADAMKESTSALPEQYLKTFITFRGLAKNSEEIVALAKVVLESGGADAFEASLPLEKAIADKNRELFFQKRSELMERLGDAWCDINKPYEPLWSRLKERADAPIILTYKNKAAVKKLCGYFGTDL